MARQLFALAFLIVSSPWLLAQESHWGTEPLSLSVEEIHSKASQIAKAETGDVEYLLQETLVRIEADGRTTETQRFIYRVLTEAGVEEFGSVEAEWSPWYQDRPKVEARVINGSNDEVRLIEREIVEGPVQHSDSVYSDRRKLQAPLPAVSPGSVIETVVITKDQQCFFSAGTAEYRFFNRFYPTKHVRLVVDVADSLPFHHHEHGPGLKFTEKREDGRLVCTWETVEPLGFDDFEWSAPSDVLQGTQIAFSTGESWASIVAGYSALVESRLSAPNLKSQVEKIAGGETEARGKAEKLLSYVQQQVRYTGLMFGDGSIVPTDPEETLRRRYGDCKDQSALLIAMLRHAGLDANPVLIKSSLGQDVMPGIPGLGQFNHMIVHVSGEPELWIDPVATTVPLGQLPVTDQNRQCLIIRDGEESLRRSPGSKPEDNGLRRVREFRIVEGGDSTLTESTVYFGSLASDVRQVIVATSEKEFRDTYRENTMERLMTANVSDIRWNSIRDTKAPLEITLNCVGTKLADCQQNSGEVLLIPSVILQGLPEELLDSRPYMTADDLEVYRRDPSSAAAKKLMEEKQKPRIHRLPLDTPQTLKLTNRIHWPAGFETVDVPENQKFRIAGGYLTVNYHIERDGVLIAEFALSTGSGSLTPDEVREWQDCVRKLFGEGEVLEWQVVVRATHSANQFFERGSVKLGLQQLRKQVTEHPENPAHRIRLAEAYADAGYAAMARNMALQTMEQFPESFAACLSAAKIYDQPLVTDGITFQEDRTKAIGYCREAIRLAPDETTSRFILGALLQSSPKGVLSDRATLLECAALFRTSEETLLPTGHIFVLQCLYFAGEYAEVCRYHDKHMTDDSLLFYKLASIAVSDGVDNAVSLLKQELSADKKLETAAATELHLELVREYEKAGELLSVMEKWPGTQKLQLRSKIAQLKAMRRYETVLKPETEPIGVVQRLIINSLTGQEECGSNSLLLHHSNERAGEIAQQIVGQWIGRRRTDLLNSASRMADTISLADFQQSGNAASGFKVTASIGFMTDVTFFLTAVDGRLKVLTSTTSPRTLGEDALELLEKGQLLQARQCIAWASEELAVTAASPDPFIGSSFARVWTKNDSVNANAARVRFGALMLSMPEKCPDALPALLEMRRLVRQPEQLQIDRKIVVWATHYENWKEGLAAVDRLMHYPQGRDAYWTTKVKLLISDKQYSQALAWIEPQLRSRPADPEPLRLKARIELEQGNLQESLRLLRLICESPEAGCREFSQAAWTALLAGAVDERAINDAEKAVEMSGSTDVASLQTMASVWAENGKVNDAMTALQRCILLRRDGSDSFDDDFVFGRMAEQMGMSDVANFYYDKLLSAEKSPEPGSAAALAVQRRGRMKTVSHQTTTTK